MNHPLATLLSLLDAAREVVIQAHDFPDHDAIASAWALANLLRRKGFTVSVTAAGPIGGISLTAMMDRLSIVLEPFRADNSRQVITVDGSPANGTVKKTAGELVGVIDHHPSPKKPVCPFHDIRTDHGSCSSIVWSYWKDAGEEPDPVSATALLAGIQLDTDFLSRRVSPGDLEAHCALFFLGDRELAREVVRTTLTVSQLPHIAKALANCRVQRDILACEVGKDCESELLSVLADFLLRLREIAFVVVVEAKGPEFRLSARSRDPRVDAGSAIRQALSSMGEGGGHRHMAGGVINPKQYPGIDSLLEIIASEVEAQRRQHERDD